MTLNLKFMNVKKLAENNLKLHKIDLNSLHNFWDFRFYNKIDV